MTAQSSADIDVIVVGGGLSGLLVTKLLTAKGLNVLGLEQSEILGGRAVVGHHRVYDQSTVSFFQELVPDVVWEAAEAVPQVRRKGQWEELLEPDQVQDEAFYLRKHFFTARTGSDDFVNRLSDQVTNLYQKRKYVSDVDTQEGIVKCVDGTNFKYGSLVWCSGIQSLNKAWKGDREPVQRFLKKMGQARGGINLQWEVTGPIVPAGNTVVFPFRFKEYRLNALGFQESTGDGRFLFQLLLFLPEELSEDREEVAKCLRALHREFEKDFPESKAKITSEKIVFLPEVSGEEAAKVRGLEISSNVYYVGPQVYVDDADASLQNWDLIARNSRIVEAALTHVVKTG